MKVERGHHCPLGIIKYLYVNFLIVLFLLTFQSHATMETFLEHLAFSSGQDPLEFRLNNLLTSGDVLMTGDPFVGPNLIPQIVEDLKVSSDFEARKIQVKEFNLVCLQFL